MSSERQGLLLAVSISLVKSEHHPVSNSTEMKIDSRGEFKKDLTLASFCPIGQRHRFIYDKEWPAKRSERMLANVEWKGKKKGLSPSSCGGPWPRGPCSS